MRPSGRTEEDVQACALGPRTAGAETALQLKWRERATALQDEVVRC